MSTAPPTGQYNPLAVTKGLIRRFENPKTQAALDLGIAEMGPNDHLGVIVHHLYDTTGAVIEIDARPELPPKI